jgi:hypothetical protein
LETKRSFARSLAQVAVAAFACALAACDSPTTSSEDLDPVTVTVSPESPTAAGPTGKTYKVEGDDNEPDEFREYDWRTTFTLTVRLSEDAANEDLDLDFPVTLTSASLKVNQATGGIVTPPTGGEAERYESVSSASSNLFTGVGSTQTIGWEVFYDNPNLRREALVTVSLGFKDDQGRTFGETVEVRIAP